MPVLGWALAPPWVVWPEPGRWDLAPLPVGKLQSYQSRAGRRTQLQSCPCTTKLSQGSLTAQLVQEAQHELPVPVPVLEPVGTPWSVPVPWVPVFEPVPVVPVPAGTA